jgi:hypothetical protein
MDPITGVSAVPRITLHAQPAPHRQGKDGLSWQIAVYFDDNLISERLTLKDPLNSEQKDECKWYIEEYVRVSPYSVTRARAAAGYLENYARSIIEQLGLVTVVDSVPRRTTAAKHNVLVEVIEGHVEDGDPEDTVHQLHWELLEDEASWARHDLNIVVRE